MDPFKLMEQTAISTARHQRDKFMVAAFVANLIRYKQEGSNRSGTSSWRWRQTRRFSTRNAMESSGCSNTIAI